VKRASKEVESDRISSGWVDRKFRKCVSLERGYKPGSVAGARYLAPVVVIPLGRPLPDGSCDRLGAGSARATPAGFPAAPAWSCTGWGLPCPFRHRKSGALLPHHFTLACPPALARRRPGGIFSVALSFESPRLAVSQHPALWSPDFPRRTTFRRPAATTHRAPARSAGSIAAIPAVSRVYRSAGVKPGLFSVRAGRKRRRLFSPRARQEQLRPAPS
jgi:hypothetical protein